MKLSKITLVFFALIGRIFSTGIVVRTHDPEEWSRLMIEAMVNVLASCYSNAEFGIGLYGYLPETFIATLNSQKPIAIYLINETDCDDRPIFQRRKLNLFVIIASDWQDVMHGLDRIQCSRWFNRRASFLIVNWKSAAKYEKSDLVNIFYSAWLKKLLNVNILCLHPTRSRMLLGYNPHTNRAPAPWKPVEISEGQRLLTLSIFEREYNRQSICVNLDFDKTIDLGGSLIEFTELPLSKSRVKQTKNLYPLTMLYGHETGNILETFVRQVNGTSVLRKAETLLAPIKGCSTYRLNYENWINIETSYPHMQMDLMIMTNFVGYKSQLEKIIGVVDRYSQLGICLVLMNTLIFFKFFVRQASIHAILNTFRMICNAGFTNVPQKVAVRIYVGCVLLFLVTIHGIFTGHLAHLLTRDIPNHQAKTLEDLLRRNYTIYARLSFGNLFTDPIFEGRVVILDVLGVDCLEYLLRDQWGACLDLPHLLLDAAASYNVKMSSSSVFHLYWALRTEEDWHLVDRLNKIHTTMTETGIDDSLKDRVMRERLSYVDPDDPHPKVMTLKDLQFDFVILSIGLGCATTIFIIEISMKTLRLALRRIRVNCWNFVG